LPDIGFDIGAIKPLICMVRTAGLEPAWPFDLWILSLYSSSIREPPLADKTTQFADF
jgi:hypothetical protein